MIENISIPAILNFGFLGLSFLMVYLGYRLTSGVVSQENASAERIHATQFFLKAALVFMLLAGPLQWITLAITAYTKNESVVLLVGANNPSWSDDFGEVYFSGKGELIPISRQMKKLEFSNNDEVRIELSKVIDAIREMRQTIISLNANRLKDKPEIRTAIEGG